MKRKVTLTPDELLGLSDQGFTHQQLAEHMGITRQRVSQLVGKAEHLEEIDVWECGHQPRCEPVKRNWKGLRGDVAALRLRGMGTAEIAQTLGISKPWVWLVESGQHSGNNPTPLAGDKGATPLRREEAPTPQRKAG